MVSKLSSTLQKKESGPIVHWYFPSDRHCWLQKPGDLRFAFCRTSGYICEDGVGLVGDIVRMYRTYDYKTQVLAASIRNTKHIIECVEVGADVATCPLSAIKGLLNHPLTDSGLKKFLEDYKKVNG